MLNKSMTLNEMVKYEPSGEEMLSMPLNVVVYLKASLISMSLNDNYDFIKFFFCDDEINNYINDINKTIIYDFDGSKTSQEKIISIFDLTSKVNFSELAIYLEELLNKYTHEADVIIDLFTHDSKKYRLSNLEGIVKLEQLNG